MLQTEYLTPAQRSWLDLRFGMFVCYNLNTFYGRGWTDGTCSPAAVDPRRFAPEQWAEVARRGGMRYAVIVAKHHDGFCIWPTRKTDYCITASPFHGDMLKQIIRAFQGVGIRVGIYYSLWDRHEPCYQDDDAYSRFMEDQLTELLSDYGEVIEFWFDGAWDKGNYNWFDLGRWRWPELYEHIKRLQPHCLVLNNPTLAHRGEMLTWPVDLNCIEGIHHIRDGVEIDPDIRALRRVGTVGQDVEDVSWPVVHLPAETCDTIGGRWFHTYGPEGPRYRSVETLREWLHVARRNGGNLALSVPPSPEGVIPDEAGEILQALGELLQHEKSTTRGSERNE